MSHMTFVCLQMILFVRVMLNDFVFIAGAPTHRFPNLGTATKNVQTFGSIVPLRVTCASTVEMKVIVVAL